MTGKHIEAVYDSYAWIYDLVFGKVFQSGRERAPVLLKLYSGAKLLEVGVGTGLSLPLCSRNINFTGIDLSQKMLDRACRRADTLGLKKVHLLKMDATTHESRQLLRSRARAYFISTVPDPVRVNQEMKRVSRPGGYLVFLKSLPQRQQFRPSFRESALPFFIESASRQTWNFGTHGCCRTRNRAP